MRYAILLLLAFVAAGALHAADAGPEALAPIRVGGPSWPKVEASAQAQARPWIARLGSTDPGLRAEARAKLLMLGKTVRPLVVEGLYHDNALVRTECAVLLGDERAQDALKFLVEAFYAAMPERGEAPTYQRTFVRALVGALERLSGRSFSVVEARSPLIQGTLRDYIGWYNEHIERLPAQMGEPDLSPLDPRYFEKVQALRALVLEKRAWPRPPLSVDMAVGRESTGPSGEAWTPVRPADRAYLETIPTLPRDEEGGFFRPEDKRWAEELLRQGRAEGAK
ncbi:MAG: hypothetical protein KIS92_26620 [Planctomycetota bacterium]|nr:hypothetical protein [Planctomycetota bacterium]